MKFVMYHYVRPELPEFPNFKALHIDDFRKQLDFFEGEFGFVSRSDFQSCFDGNSCISIPDGVVLTFDDGLSDHYDFVYEELSRRNLWGIFYVPTGPYEQQKLLDVHRIHCLLGKHGGRKMLQAVIDQIDSEMVKFENIDEFRSMTYARQDNDDDSLKFKRLFNYFLQHDYRKKVLDGLVGEFLDEKILFNEFYMTPSQMSEMQDKGMIIGGHTVNHPVLSTLDKSTQTTEIKNCFSWLENAIGELDIITFCYPYGGDHSFDKNSIEILNSLECSFALSVEQRSVSNDDMRNRRLALPRYDCNQFRYGQVRKVGVNN